MTEETKYCRDAMKKNFNKELLITTESNENLKKSTRCWIFDNDYIDTDVKVIDHCHITRNYRESAHRDCNILKLQNSCRISQCKNYDSHLRMLSKFNPKTTVAPNIWALLSMIS